MYCFKFIQLVLTTPSDSTQSTHMDQPFWRERSVWRSTLRGASALGLCLLLGQGVNATAWEGAQPATQETQETDKEEGFVSIFDGKTLEGWEGNKDWFRVEEGSIIAGSLTKAIPHNEFLCTTKVYGDFELRLEAKLQGTGDNAGVQFRTKRIEGSTEVSGYQMDVGNAWGRPVWGALYDESRRNKLLSEGPRDQVPSWVKKGDWNALTVRAEGDKIEIWLNGHKTLQYTEEDAKIDREGIIALQIHSGPPTEALYRNIRIKQLDKKN